MLNSLNYWVWYLENRNHFIEHFALFESYKSEHFQAFPAELCLKKKSHLEITN
jgi:hypothetical protein